MTLNKKFQEPNKRIKMMWLQAELPWVPAQSEQKNNKDK